MKTTLSSADLCESVTRQAKRLSDYLDLPLTTAKEILAQAPYRCASWRDLCARIESRQLDEHILLLASLPRSDEAKSYFWLHIEQLSRSLSQHMLTNTNLTGLYETLRRVFSVSDEPVTLSDIAPSVSISTWQSMGIGPDPDAIIESTTSINGVPIKLIGTRIYMPKYYIFGDEVTCPPEVAEPCGETFRVIWSNPKAWYDAAYRYLTLPDDEDEYIELVLPNEVLNDEMTNHQEWFSRVAGTWLMSHSYGDHGEDFMPFVIPGRGCYLVFGIPAATTTNLGRTAANSVRMRGDVNNDSALVLIDGQPACVEWISVCDQTRKHDGQYSEYFEELRSSVLSHRDCDLDLYRLTGWSNSYFFVRPVTQFDIDQFVKVEFEPEPGKEAFVLRSDNPSVASIVFDKVAARSVMTYPSKFREENYLIEIDVSRYENLRSFSLSLDALGQGWRRGSNLITSSIVQQEGSHKTLYINIQPELLALADTISKKVLKDAVQFGWILHQPAGFSERLKQPPKRCQCLRAAPKELVDLFERSWSRAGDASHFDLIRNARRIRYRRDNF